MKRIHLRYLLVCLGLIVGLVLPGCVLAPETAAPQAPASTAVTTSTVTGVEPEWTPPTFSSESEALPTFADVVAEVRSAVVAVNTEYTTYDFFNRPSTEEGAGSGWIIDPKGYIVTNNHVIEGAQNITVTLADGRTFAVQQVWADSLTDLAVVTINATNLPAARIGNSAGLRIGDPVLAIGNPLGLGISAKPGWVSRLGVSLEVSSGQTLYDLLETDAPINPGNSGGALVSMAGEVIGITSAKISMVGVEGMGYAIPVNAAMPIINELIQKGYVVRPSLGLTTLYNVDPYVIFRYRLAVEGGAFVAGVAVGGPAEEAGIMPRDVITGFNGKAIATADELLQAIHASQIGEQVSITYWRGGTPYTVDVTTVESAPP